MTATARPDTVLPNGQDIDSAIAEGRRAYELDRRHVFHSWSAQEQISPMTIVGAEGSYVWDGDGNRLLDFSSQLVFTNIGHQHRRWSPRSPSRPRSCARSPRNTPTPRVRRRPGSSPSAPLAI